MSNLIYPTDLACEAIGLTPELDTCIIAESDGNCALCGKPHKEGDKIHEADLGNSFTLNLQLSAPDSAYCCTSCSAATETQDFLKKLGCGVIYNEGIFPCLSKKDRGYWLLNPPKPPFIFNIQVSKSQHIIWRSIINYSQDVIFIRMGEDVHKIRVEQLRKGKTATQALINAQQKAFDNKLSKFKPTRTALTYADTRGQRLHQSEFYHWANTIVDIYPETQQHINDLMSLTANEAYALDFILADEYTKPEPIRTKST